MQIVWSSRHGSWRIEHLGSAHSDDELAVLKLVAAERIAAGQGQLDLGLGAGAEMGPLEVVGSTAAHLWDALCRAYDSLGFDQASGGDEVFRVLVLARIIEPTSKLDALRVLEEAGVAAPSYATLKRRLPRYGKPLWRKDISAACAAHAALGPASLVLYDVSTLYFETDQGDGFREPGFSKERRLEPQITVGLLTDATGFPLAVEAFEGNKAETATMLPTLQAFMTAHRLSDITVVADAGMLSENNKREIEAAGLGFILGNRIGHIPYVIDEWRTHNPGVDVSDGLTLTQPWPGGPNSSRRDQVIYYQYPEGELSELSLGDLPPRLVRGVGGPYREGQVVDPLLVAVHHGQSWSHRRPPGERWSGAQRIEQPGRRRAGRGSRTRATCPTAAPFLADPDPHCMAGHSLRWWSYPPRRSRRAKAAMPAAAAATPMAVITRTAVRVMGWPGSRAK